MCFNYTCAEKVPIIYSITAKFGRYLFDGLKVIIFINILKY